MFGVIKRAWNQTKIQRLSESLKDIENRLDALPKHEISLVAVNFTDYKKELETRGVYESTMPTIIQQFQSLAREGLTKGWDYYHAALACGMWAVFLEAVTLVGKEENEEGKALLKKIETVYEKYIPDAFI